MTNHCIEEAPAAGKHTVDAENPFMLEESVSDDERTNQNITAGFDDNN